jgi:hypothetical protein
VAAFLALIAPLLSKLSSLAVVMYLSNNL